MVSLQLCLLSDGSWHTSPTSGLLPALSLRESSLLEPTCTPRPVYPRSGAPAWRSQITPEWRCQAPRSSLAGRNGTGPWTWGGRRASRLGESSRTPHLPPPVAAVPTGAPRSRRVQPFCLWVGAGECQPAARNTPLLPCELDTTPAPDGAAGGRKSTSVGAERIRTGRRRFSVRQEAPAAAARKTDPGGPDRIRTGDLVLDRDACSATTPRDPLPLRVYANRVRLRRERSVSRGQPFAERVPSHPSRCPSGWADASTRRSAAWSVSWRRAMVRSPRVFSRIPRTLSVVRRSPPVSASG